MGLEAATKALLDAGTFMIVETDAVLMCIDRHYIRRCRGCVRWLLLRRLMLRTSEPCLSLPRSVSDARLCSQRALYNLGLTGIPITNVNSNCSTGSTALYHANTLVKSGIAECTLALGFERMARGSLGNNWPDRPSPVKPFNMASEETEELLSTGKNHGPGAPRMFDNAAQEYFDKYGAKLEHLAQIG